MKVLEVAQINDQDGGVPTNLFDVVKALKIRSFPETPLKDILKEIDITLHDVMDPVLRPRRPVYKKKDVKRAKKYAGSPEDIDPNEPELVRWEDPNRITLPFQLMICDKRVSFCLANPAIRTYKGLKGNESATDLEKLSFALERVLFDNKIATWDREVARNIFTYTEVAEYIYPVQGDSEHERYGFKTKVRLKLALFTRENGEKFYPIKNALGDLICFSREYKKRENNRLVTYFQSFTDEEIITFRQLGASNWEIASNPAKHAHELGKMPIVFGWQRHPEYHNVKRLIARLELLLSNHAEVNDYHAAPKLLLKNAEQIDGFGEKGSASMVIQAKGDADMKYVTWEHATDSVKLEVDNLLTQIYTMTQTPNINFDNLKGLGAVSGVSIKLMFMDAHLAVKDKEGVLLDYFQRRNSIICAYLGNLNTSLKSIVDKVEINNALDPFMIADDKEKAEILQIENGNQPVKSQETSVTESGGDKEEFDKITKETAARKVVDVTEPTY